MQNLKFPTIPPPQVPKIQMIEKDGGHWLSTQDTTLLLIYIKELNAYTEKLRLQNSILKGENNEMSIQ